MDSDILPSLGLDFREAVCGRVGRRTGKKIGYQKWLLMPAKQKRDGGGNEKGKGRPTKYFWRPSLVLSRLDEINAMVLQRQSRRGHHVIVAGIGIGVK